jgi:uncharacterized protein YndB with AHSA1/START domain
MKENPPAMEPIVVECDLPYPPAQVWRALTEQHLLAAWLMPNDLRPEAGARFRFQPEGREAKGDAIDCEVLEAEPNRLLRWRQSEAAPCDPGHQSIDSVVTVELTARPGGTRLRLVHDTFTLVVGSLQRRSAPRASATVVPLRFGRSKDTCQLQGTRRLVTLLRAAA